MENILDEQLEEKEILKPIPSIIYLFMATVFIYFLGSLFIIQSWPYGALIRNVGALSIVLIGGLSLPVFKEKKDAYLNFYCILFVVGGLSKIMLRSMAYNDPIAVLLNFGAQFFVIGILLTLNRYFALRRPKKTSLNIIRYPLLVVIPIWIIGFFFKMQSWPFASEILTVSVFLFFLGTIIMLIRHLKKEVPALRGVTIWLVLMVNMLIAGILFKMQAWPYASELISISFLGGALGIMFKLMQQQKLLKIQEETTGED